MSIQAGHAECFVGTIRLDRRDHMKRSKDITKHDLTVGTVYREWTSECLVELEELITGGMARVKVIEQAPRKPGLDKRLNDVFMTTQTFLKKP